ncbi:MAG: glycosyltransferase [bacterium]
MAVRIAFVIDHLVVGGTEKQLVELIRRLDRDRFEPLLFVLRQLEPNLNEQITPCKPRALGVRDVVRAASLERLVRLARTLRENRIRIVQTFFPDGSLMGVLAARAAGVPVIIASRRDMGSWHRWPDRLKLRIASGAAHRILVNSAAVREHLCETEGVRREKTDLIHNGIDIDFYRGVRRAAGAPPNGRVTIGTVSNFNRYVKRLDVFVKAMTALARKYDHVDFLVVGNVEEKHWQLDLSGLGNRLTFTGEVADVREYLGRMDVGVLCSDSEGFSNVILQYMASGVPCVCTRTGGNPEIVDHGINGFLFPAGDHAALAELAGVLVEDDRRRSLFAGRSREKVEGVFDWKRVLADYESYYQRLLTRKGLERCRTDRSSA